MCTNKNTKYVSSSRVIHITILCSKKCQTRYIVTFWRNFWQDFCCTEFYHFSTRVWTRFWQSKLSSFDLSCIIRINEYPVWIVIYINKFHQCFTCKNVATEMSNDRNCQIETARPNRPDRIGQTVSARPKSRVSLLCLILECVWW